jgi:hypothetical protein
MMVNITKGEVIKDDYGYAVKLHCEFEDGQYGGLWLCRNDPFLSLFHTEARVFLFKKNATKSMNKYTGKTIDCETYVGA